MVYLHPSLQGQEFNFHQIALMPYKIPDFPRIAVNLKTRATRNLYIHLPLASAPMDTVTEAEMAIAVELLGGIGVIHYNSSVDEQLARLERVKHYKAAFVRKPVCLKPDSTVDDVYKIHDERGFFSVPVTEDGTPDSRLLGFVSGKDVRYIDNRSRQLKDGVMTPRENLITAPRSQTLDKGDTSGIKAANDIIVRENLDRLVIVDEYDRPCALVTDRDLRLHEEYKHATVDADKRLLGFIAVKGDWHNPARREAEQDRIRRAVKAGADGIVVDQGVVYASQPEIVRWIKQNFPHVQTGAGNICCAELVDELMMRAGDFIDFAKTGVGPGAACKTTQYLGIGRDQPSAVYDCAQAMNKWKEKYGENVPPIWADGGIRKPGDAVKVLALGANVCMVGGLVAGTDEAPGKRIPRGEGRYVKEFRGMGSIKAMEAGGDARYTMDPEAVMVEEGYDLEVPYQGPVKGVIIKFREGVKQAMNKIGFKTIEELQNECKIIPINERG